MDPSLELNWMLLVTNLVWSVSISVEAGAEMNWWPETTAPAPLLTRVVTGLDMLFELNWEAEDCCIVDWWLAGSKSLLTSILRPNDSRSSWLKARPPGAFLINSVFAGLKMDFYKINLITFFLIFNLVLTEPVMMVLSRQWLVFMRAPLLSGWECVPGNWGKEISALLRRLSWTNI